MTRYALFALAFLPALVFAAPVPKSTAKPITTDNADKVRSVSSVERRAYRLLAGPARGELIAFEHDGPAEVLDEATLKPLRTLAGKQNVTDFAVSRDGKHTAWLERGSKNYTLATGDKTIQIEIGQYAGNAAFSPDGKTLAIGHTVWVQNGPGVNFSEVRLYDLSGKLVRTLEQSGPGGLTLVFSPDGKTLAVGNRNHETKLFDAATGKLLHALDKKMTQEIAFSPDGKTLAAGYVDGTVGLWEVATGVATVAVAAVGYEEVYAVAWNLKGDVLATAGRGGKVILWEPREMKKLKELDAGSWVIQVRFTSDGSRLLTSSASDHSAKSDRKIEVWGLGDK